jgi:hypothetical protein
MSEYPTIESRFQNHIPTFPDVRFHYHLFLLHTTMTLTKWTSIFIALAFALPLVSAVFDQLGLNYNLRSMIYVDSLRQTFSLEYSISHSYALTWTVRAAGVGDLFVFALLQFNMKEVKLEA